MLDFGKYSNKIKYGNFNWPLKYCTVGKKIRNPQERKQTFVTEIHFDTLQRVLKNTDWKRTQVYKKFIEHGRWVHSDTQIYSELELKYLSSSLGNMANENNNEEFNLNEGYAIIVKHWSKTIETLQTLMCNMNMMYYFERLKLKFKQFERPGVMPSLIHLGKLMRRCLKLYQMIDSFMNIFKLIKLKEVIIFFFF